MLSRLGRVSLQRLVHTSATRHPPRLKVGAFAAGFGIAGAAAYAFSVSLQRPIRLDEQPSDSENDSKEPPAADSDSEPSPDSEGGQNTGAFNPETGEINWDCPCLGGMANGPCGEQFKEAFSCFVYSEDEPKGINCVEKFKGMQECFREHPDVYGDEIMDDDESEGQAAEEPSEERAPAPATATTKSPAPVVPASPSDHAPDPSTTKSSSKKLSSSSA